MEEERQPLSRRRSSGRVRKSPERFVPVPSGKQAGGDFAQPEKKQNPAPAKLELPAEELLHRRISVFFSEDDEWYDGRVTSFDPEAAGDNVRIEYDDGDTHEGMLGAETLRTGSGEYEYKLLEATSEAVGTAEGDADPSEAGPSSPKQGRPRGRPGKGKTKRSAAKQQQLAADAKADSGAQPSEGTAAAAPAAKKGHLGKRKKRPAAEPERPDAAESVAGDSDAVVANHAASASLPPPKKIQAGKAEALSAAELPANEKPAAQPGFSSAPTPAPLEKVAGSANGKSAEEASPEPAKRKEADAADSQLAAKRRKTPAPSEAQLTQQNGSGLAVTGPVASSAQAPKAEAAPAAGAEKTTSPQKVGPVAEATKAEPAPGAAAPKLGERQKAGAAKAEPAKAEGRKKRSLDFNAATGKAAAAAPKPSPAAASATGSPTQQLGVSGRKLPVFNEASLAEPSPATAAKPEAGARDGQGGAKPGPVPAAAPGSAKTSPASLSGGSLPAAAPPEAMKAAPRVTSIARPKSLQLLPTTPTPLPASQPSPEPPEQQATASLSPPPRSAAEEQLEADIICDQMAAQLAGLTRARDSIGRAGALALSAAEVNAAPRVIRLIADAMEKVDTPAKRVDILYLVDSILQGCLREGRHGCGPGSAAADAFPRVVAAALPRLISAVMVSSEGVEKASKVLSIWQKRRLVSESLLQPQLEKLSAARETLAAQPARPSPATAAPSTGPPQKGRIIQVALGAGSGGTVSAVLEDQYGTTTAEGADLLVRREDSSESDSDDEPDAHEQELRAQTDAARRREAEPFAQPRSLPKPAPDRPAGTPWATGMHAAPAHGASPSSIHIQLARNTPPTRPRPAMAPAGAPWSWGPSTHRAPPLSSLGGGMRRDAGLDAAGATDRTFEEQPPLPPEDWEQPPLPLEAPPPLPDEEEGPPPLPMEDEGFRPPLPQSGPYYAQMQPGAWMASRQGYHQPQPQPGYMQQRPMFPPGGANPYGLQYPQRPRNPYM